MTKHNMLLTNRFPLYPVFVHFITNCIPSSPSESLQTLWQVNVGEDGWPVHEDSFTVTAGQTVTVTTRPDVQASSTVLPITYDKFTEMAQKGDTIYVGRYLVSGADSASLYLDVVDVQGGI